MNGSSPTTVTQSAQRKSTIRVSKRPKTLTVSLLKNDCRRRPSKSYSLASIAPTYEILDEPNRPDLSVYEQSDKTLIIETGNYDLGQFAKSLFLLRDSLVSCLGGDSINRVVSISKPQADHFSMLFDFLVASAHESSAQAIMGKYCDTTNTVPSRRPLGTAAQPHPQDEFITGGQASNTAWYLFEENVTMETPIGAVQAKILSARSNKAMITLGFELQYTGHQRLALSPFVINFTSLALINHEFIRGPHNSLVIDIDSEEILRVAGIKAIRTAVKDKTGDRRLVWIHQDDWNTGRVFWPVDNRDGELMKDWELNKVLKLLSDDLGNPLMALLLYTTIGHMRTRRFEELLWKDYASWRIFPRLMYLAED